MTPPPAQLNILRTFTGRWFLLSAALFVTLWIVRIVALPTFPTLLEIFRKVVSLSFIASSVAIVALTIRRNRFRLLWRVRRKLILSYLLIGLVPIVLVLAFILAGGVVLYNNVAAYLFQEGFSDLEEEIHQIAITAASEIDRVPASPQIALDRKYANAIDRYPELSLIVLKTDAITGAELARAGQWTHTKPPETIPRWLQVAREFKGVVAMAAPGSEAQPDLLIRVAAQTADHTKTIVVDLPFDTDMIARLADKVGTRMRGASRMQSASDKNLAKVLPALTPVVPPRQSVVSAPSGVAFRQSVVTMDFTDWDTGATGSVAIGLDAPADRLYRRMANLARLPISPDLLLIFLIVLVILFLIIQGVALIIGGILARSITSAVHELFVGTERVQQGDFAHRIKIETRDQLGDLADSFNRMSASIEHLLHVQREKQRMEDELRIARDIQQSLLPTAVPVLPGMSIAALCEPAREVGGDYYDFFDLGGGRLGVLIADVSGKGTSAALYMAELKGIMLALSHTERSPRRLLVNVNHMLAEHLDNRSFITMTYAVIDLHARTLTCARAGHTPLIVVTRQGSEVLMPNGMVLGLRLPGAGQRFEELLEEHTMTFADSDVVVLYTDGITEAMDGRGELFGDSTLADVIAAHRDLDADQIRERVLSAVRTFVGDAEPHDDMTMVILKFQDAAEAAA